ncbi:hypothetical protein J2Z44_001682 [Clostridium punense]|uniref:Uncharacterized protein n=1 Tax=Clostridium punense TaxID=1054297 RepID=A0ABS4K431_9CLOT|nr:MULTISPECIES: hypothetical protein [Clostridium]EQB90142.1 hypothetical protein M918_01280 [Clostridium sp. BL8]MBP2021886.1 hypothetical protein [Clostridium punense]
MQYFSIGQDKQVQNCISFTDFKTDEHAILLKEDADTFNDITTIFVEGQGDSLYPDFIESPVFLVSDELKKVLAMYDDTLIFKTVILSNLKEQSQKIYWLLLTDILDALSEKTEFYKNGWEKHIVIDHKKVQGYKVFQIKGLKKSRLFIHLDVAESMLRRNFKCIEYREIETEIDEVI